MDGKTVLLYGGVAHDKDGTSVSIPCRQSQGPEDVSPKFISPDNELGRYFERA